LGNTTPAGHSTMADLGLRGTLGSLHHHLMPGGFHLSAQLRVRGDGALRLELGIIFQNVHNHQLDPQVGSETDSGIHSVARPRGGTCCHQNIAKHAILLSRVLSATLGEAAKKLASTYDSIAQGQVVRVCSDIPIAIFPKVHYGVLSSLYWWPLVPRGASPQGLISVAR